MANILSYTGEARRTSMMNMSEGISAPVKKLKDQ